MKQNEFNPREFNTYQTGSTTPPKHHNGVVAILLVLVILLSGLVSILSLLNIRLFSTVYETQKKQDVPLSLEIAHYPKDSSINTAEELFTATGSRSIGIAGDPVTPVYQRHFQLPEGLFITYIEKNSHAHRQGIQEGDVLLSLDDVPITNQKDLSAFLKMHAVGDDCVAEIYRRDDNKQMSFTVKIEEITP